MHLERRAHGGVDVVGLGLPRVKDLHREPPSRDLEDGRLVEVVAELLGVQSGGGDEQPQVGAKTGDVFDEPKKHVGAERALVRLVDHHDAVGRQVRFGQKLAEEHAVGHVLEDRLVRGAILEADRVPDLLAQA